MRRYAVLALFVCFVVGSNSGCRPAEAQAVGDHGDRKDVGVAIRQVGLLQSKQIWKKGSTPLRHGSWKRAGSRG